LVIDGDSELINDSFRNLKIFTQDKLIRDEDDPVLKNYTKVCVTSNEYHKTRGQIVSVTKTDHWKQLNGTIYSEIKTGSAIDVTFGGSLYERYYWFHANHTQDTEASSQRIWFLPEHLNSKWFGPDSHNEQPNFNRHVQVNNLNAYERAVD